MRRRAPHSPDTLRATIGSRLSMMSSEPDYKPVNQNDDPEAKGEIPDSFYGKPKNSGFSIWSFRNYNCRRRLGAGGLLTLFLVGGILVALELSRRRGHLGDNSEGGANSFLNSDPAVAVQAMKGMSAMVAGGRTLSIATWNIAAINNNPFEYWITYNDVYEDVMKKVEDFLEQPGEHDVPVSQVFTQQMFDELDSNLTGVANWASVKNYWEKDFKNRKIVSEFMKDPSLGSKRLISMPDRVTNTIFFAGNPDPLCRPTVINQYDGWLPDLDTWWKDWSKFIFTKEIKIKSTEATRGVVKKIPYEMLKPIKKSKYPDITTEEEKDSLPLQTLCLAIFDAILVNMMNTVTTSDIWQDLRRTMSQSLNKMKVPHTLNILETTYIDMDVIMLQEVSTSFIDQAKNSKLNEVYHIVAPANLDLGRDQNSVIFLNRKSFPGGASSEITGLVQSTFPTGAEAPPVADGDILALTATNADGVPFVLASFHGDTNGLATKPVFGALDTAVKSNFPSYRVIFGLDANTYEHASKKQQDVMDWGNFYSQRGFTSCWGDLPDPGNYTTYNARTYLQTQLNKACKQADKREKGDVNPKDFILFGKQDFMVLNTWKDNTGQRKYTEDMPFPTLDFPSDHGILSAVLVPLEPTE